VTALLEARGVTVAYGGVRANEDVDLRVERGRFVGLIGSNGAGKTTFIDAITGFAPLTAGSVWLDGEDITADAPDVRARKGLVRTFQSLELFDDLTVRDNLLVACEPTPWSTLAVDLFRRSIPAEIDDRVGWALRTLEIEHLGDRLPRDLSHGHRKLAGVARALAARPKLLLVDEPAAGLDADESADLARHLRSVLDEGISVLLIDHDMGLVLSVCDEINVLDFGRLIACGTPAEIRRDPAVVAAYLGESAAHATGGPGADR
jgi:branched-chain amino acid transport system ATP-binding protein